MGCVKVIELLIIVGEAIRFIICYGFSFMNVRNSFQSFFLRDSISFLINTGDIAVLVLGIKLLRLSIESLKMEALCLALRWSDMTDDATSYL